MRYIHLAFIASAGSTFAQTPAEIPRLVADLGARDFRTREAAADRLRALGAPAIDPLRDSLSAGTPEANRRAELLIAQIRQRLSDDAAIAPKMVSVKQTGPLRDLLGELRKQTTYEFRLTGDGMLLSKEVTLDTHGKAPFWAAVQSLCDAAALEVDGTGVVRDAITLRPRGAARPNPSSFIGGVRIEVVPVENLAAYSTAQLPVRLQFLPEPGVRWVRVTDVVATKAVDTLGDRLNNDFTARTTLTVTDPNSKFANTKYDPGRGNALRATCVVSVPTRGEVSKLAHVEGLIRAEVWGPPEEILSAPGLRLGAETVRDARGRSTLNARIVTNRENPRIPFLEVELVFDSTQVKPRSTGAESHDPPIWLGQGARGQVLPIRPAGAKPQREMVRNEYGLSLTDAEGQPFVLYQHSSETTRLLGSDGEYALFALKSRLTYRPVGVEVIGPPAKLSFHGTRLKEVEFPFSLKDVPVTPGTARAGDAVTQPTEPWTK